MNLDSLNSKFNEVQRKVSVLEGRRETVLERQKALREQLSPVKQQEILYKQSVDLLQKVTQNLQEETTSKIAGIVTKAFQHIYQTKDEFVIQVDLKRKTPVAEFLLKRDINGKTIYLDPMEEDGGGKVDVLAFALKVAGLLLYKPELRRIIILDEPFKHVSQFSAEYRQRAAEFLRHLCDEHGIQMILTTHAKEFVDVANRVFEVNLDDQNVSHVLVRMPTL